MRSLAAGLCALAIVVPVAGSGCTWDVAKRADQEQPPDVDEIFALVPALIDGMAYRAVRVGHVEHAVRKKEVAQKASDDAAYAVELLAAVPKVTLFEGEARERTQALTEAVMGDLEAVRAHAADAEYDAMKGRVSKAEASCQELIRYVRWVQENYSVPKVMPRSRRGFRGGAK